MNEELEHLAAELTRNYLDKDNPEAETLREMVERAGDRIQILAGGGIRPNNAAKVAALTGCTQLHGSAGRKCTDPSCRNNPDIHFGSPLYLPEDQFSMTDPERVRGLLSALGR